MNETRLIFSSAQLPDHLNDQDRFKLWGEIFREEIGAVEFSTSENLPFRAVIEATEFGPVSYARNEGTICCSKRGKNEIQSYSVGCYSLLINMGNELMGGVYGHDELNLAPGGAFIDALEPLVINGGDYNKWTNVIIPQAVLDASYTRVGDCQGLAIDPNSEALWLMRNYLQMIDAGPPPTLPAITDHVSETIIDLFALAAGAKGDEAHSAGLRGLRAARLQAVLAYLQVNYTRPGLSAQEVGQGLGLSSRYIQDLLATTGQCLSDRLLELRLQHARKLLSGQNGRQMRISDIIYDSGFGDVSYFNRCFRRRFGCSPTSAR